MHPFSRNPGETVSALGEEKLIALIRRWLGGVSPPAPRGIGDDCAILPPARAKRPQAVTVDPVIYGRHFDDTVPPRLVGAKLLKRNLSDLAAMGAWPLALVDTVTGPRDVIERVDALERVATEQPDRALGGTDQTEHHPQRGCLSGSVGAEVSVHVAGVDRDVHAGDGHEVPVALDQAADLERWGSAHRARAASSAADGGTDPNTV